MTKILVLYYSSYGHIEQMAAAEAEGARSVPGVDVVVKRVPELVPADVAKSSGFKLDQAAPIADPRASATWRHRCATSSTRPAACGCEAR
jgi:NAD(P)H dehydrogenase (quinone)